MTRIVLMTGIAVSAVALAAHAAVDANGPVAGREAVFAKGIAAGDRTGADAHTRMAQNDVKGTSKTAGKKRAKKIKYKCITTAEGTVVCPPTLPAKKTKSIKGK